MIPKNIHREHVLKAIEEIKRSGIPAGRGSRKFLIAFNGDYYPPKYVISLANRYANGEELNPSEFSGGTESNNFLRALGFVIVEVKLPEKTKHIPLKERRETALSITHHDERCPKCKETIRKLLERIYGEVKQNYKFEVGTRLEDFLDASCYGKLKEIYGALQNHRGFREFVKAATLPHCDFFVPSPGFIVEFDESQHFTLPRRIALEMYPDELELGFNRGKWIALCQKIDARDNDPPYRDEQRAWYDTLRDFLPAVKGLEPTVRLFARESRIDKTLTSTVFAMACDEAGEILTGDDGNPIAFSSAEIALINYVSHTVPVEPIIDYFVGQGETDIYIRLQLGAAFVQTEHSGTDVIGDSGYVSFWSAEYGKEWAIEVQSGDITITETYFDDSYAPSLEIYQTGKEVEEDDALNTRIFASSPVPLTTEVYEYQRWNGVRMVDDIHDLVASYSNTLSWNVVNFLAPPQPVGLDYFKPVYFVLRWGGFRNHALQPGLVINGKSELTENLGLNELEEGLIYTGNYPLTFITVGAVFQEGFVSRGSTRTLTFTDRSTGRYEDFDPLGVRNTESIEQGGVPSGIYPGEEMHYYYRILQHGIWGIEAWPAEEWINSFKSNYGLTMKEIPQITEGSIIFSGSQIDQDKIRRIVSGL